MRIFLYVALTAYCFGIGVYLVSETFYPVEAACVGCFKKELPFAGGAGSTPTNRTVGIKYNTGALSNPFAGAEATRFEAALNIATGAWNGMTTGDNGTGNHQPYNFSLNQSMSPNDVNIGVELVNDIPDAPNACASMSVVKNPDGSVRKGFLQIKRSALNGLTADEMAKLIEHELGHFMGLADNYDADHCDTVMSQAEGDCKPLSHGIQKGDVETVNKYVADPSDCSRERGVKPLHDEVGGFTDPNPSPFYYPRTCYYFYDEVPLYQFCDCNESGSPRGYRYIGSVYYLTDVFCNY
jgi:hypothetical protein